MICRKCHTENPESSVYCVSCGQPLIRSSTKHGTIVPWYVFVSGIAIFLIGAYFIIKTILPSSINEASPPDGDFPRAAVQSIPVPTTVPTLIIGGVVAKDFEGKEISALTSTLFNAKWVAVPVWSLLGGKNITFQMEESEAIPIQEGAWVSGDPILLLKLQDISQKKAPELSPWKRYRPLHWCPLMNKDQGFQLEMPRSEKRGTFVRFPLPEEIQEAGVFMQDSCVVGWAFPDWLDKGYLWLGSEGEYLEPSIKMERFLNANLPVWREAIVDKALKKENSLSSALKLETLAQGLSVASLFLEEDVPRHLRTPAIIQQMHSLASELMGTGSAAEAARILDEHTIGISHSSILLKDSVLARLETEDYNKAIQFLERMKKSIHVRDIYDMDRFHAELYKDWLRKILDQGSYFSGMVAFEEANRLFPEDLELHLLGVEVAIKEKNWAYARELLQMRDYPEKMRGWVGELENEIQEVQENEGAVTIRFSPGAEHIPVKVFLNGSHSFRFILDTGASMCSIPSSAVDRLRIDIDQSTPIRLVSTAGGIAEVYEVELESVELEGIHVFNVDALVIDIAGYRDYGLLGQNFLNNFHIEIDSQKGILRLKKR